MGLKCKISYNEQGVARVMGDNGQPSQLYSQLLTFLGSQEQALDAWASAYSKEFGEQGENADLGEVIAFLNATASTDEVLSPSEIFQVKDFMARNGIESLDKLYSTLASIFKPDSIFDIDIPQAIESGLFTEEEIRTLNPDVIDSIMVKIAGHLVKDNFTVTPHDQSEVYKNADNRTIFGTYEKVTREDIDNAILDSVDNFTDIEDFYNKIKDLPYTDFVQRFLEDDEFANTIIDKFKGLKKVPTLHIVGDAITNNNFKFYTVVKNTVISGAETLGIEADIDYLDEIDPDIWRNNPDLVQQVLKEVEMSFADINIDVVGISKMLDNRGDIMELLDAAKDLAQSQTNENLNKFVAIHERVLPTEKKNVADRYPEKYAPLNLVKVFSNKSQNELFEKFGLIKVGDNLYHKVNQEASLDDIKEYIFEEVKQGRIQMDITANFNNKPAVLEEISNILMRRTTEAPISKKELYSAYQVAFRHDPLPNKSAEVLHIADISTDETYLKTKFISDFYGYVLKEKAKDSDIYKRVLSKIDFNDSDISLSEPIDSLEDIEYREELYDYIRLKKDSSMKYLLPPVSKALTEDLLYTNFPERKSEYEGNVVIDGNYIVTDPTSDEFIKLNGFMYRKVMEKQNSNLFARIPQRQDSNYYTKVTDFTIDRVEAYTTFEKYGELSPKSIDHTKFKDVIAKSRVEDNMRPDLQELSTLKDKSYTFFEVNNSIVAYKDGVRVGSIRPGRALGDIYSDLEISVSESHRGRGIGTELYLRMFDKIGKEDITLYPSAIRTKQAQNIYSRMEDMLEMQPDGSVKVKPQETEGATWQQVADLEISQKELNNLRTSIRNRDKDSYTAEILDEVSKAMKGEDFNLPFELDFLADGITYNDVANLLMQDEIFETRTEIRNFISNRIIPISTSTAFQEVVVESETSRIKQEAIANGTFMKAPNGNPTNLTEKQWIQVRTKAFKDWFGDWINDPKNASKVVDKNGEPLVVFHGTKNDIDAYEWQQRRANFRPSALNGFWFTDNLDNAKLFGEVIVSSFINTRNPITIDVLNAEQVTDFLVEQQKISRELADYRLKKGDSATLKEVEEAIQSAMYKDKTADGVLLKNLKDKVLSNNYVVFKNTNIKSADENIGEFSSEDPRIRYQEGELDRLRVQPAQAVEAIVERLEMTGLAEAKVITNKAQFTQGLREANKANKSMATADNVFGFTLGNKVFLNKNKFNFNTPIHEFGHLWFNWAKNNRFDLYTRGMKLIEGSEYLRQIEEQAKNPNSVYHRMSPEKLKEEALVTAIGNKGEDFINKKAKEGFIGWLQDLWTAIAEAVGISQVSAEQLQDYTLDEFAQAVAIDLLKGDTFQTTQYTIQPLMDDMLVGKSSETVEVTKLESNTGYTVTMTNNITGQKEEMNLNNDGVIIGTFNDSYRGKHLSQVIGQELSDRALKGAKEGKPITLKKSGGMVNVQTIKQVLNQKGVKKIEKDIINEVLNLEAFKGKDKIPFDLFQAEVNARVMPLQVIESKTYSDYGMDNTGVEGITKTNLYNTDLDHGITGHFGSDYASKKIEPTEMEVRNIPGTTQFAVVRKGVELTQENVQDNVFHATGDKESAEQWISDYKNSLPINNEGLFGHTRVWRDGEDVYVAEIQSDSYQKAKADDMLISTYEVNPDRMTNAQKKIWNRIKEAEGIIKAADNNYVDEDTGRFIYENTPDTYDHINSIIGAIKLIEVEKKTANEEQSKILELRLEELRNALDIFTKFVKGEKLTLPNPSPKSGSYELPFNKIDRKVDNKRFLYSVNGVDIPGLDGLNLLVSKEELVSGELSVDAIVSNLEKNLKTGKTEEVLVREMLAVAEQRDNARNFVVYNAAEESLNEIREEIRLIRLNAVSLLKELKKLDEGSTITLSRPYKYFIVAMPERLENKVWNEKGEYENVGNSFDTPQEAFDFWNNYIRPRVAVDPEGYEKYFIAKRDLGKLHSQLMEAASVKDKQFIAHRKNYTERLLREEIRRNAQEGHKTLSIPTPRTLALIEGYIEDEGRQPYEVLKSDRRSDDGDLSSGDSIEYLDENYLVISANQYEIEIVKADEGWVINGDEWFSDQVSIMTDEDLYNYDQGIKERGSNKFTEAEWEEFTAEVDLYPLDSSYVDNFAEDSSLNEDGEMVYEIDRDAVEDAIREYHSNFYMDVEGNLNDIYIEVYRMDDGEFFVTEKIIYPETLKQPDQYRSADLEDFDIDDMNSTEQTILRKYEELVEKFKSERPDAIIIEDAKGNQWVRTNLTEEDGLKPVVAFQEAQQEVKIPDQNIENISSIFDSRLELLDLYSPKEEVSIKRDIDSCGL